MTATFLATSDLTKDPADSLPAVSLPERAICGYFRWLPFLWLCGLMLPVALGMVSAIFVLSVRSRRGFAFASPWFAVGIAQYLSVVINWSATDEPAAILLKHLAASYVSGWFLLGASIGIGASGIVDRSRLLRSIVRLSYYSLALAIPAYLLSFCLRRVSLFYVSPIGHLIPAGFASRNFAFGIFVYNWEDFSGILLPRLSLLSPWPTAMGAAGVCMVFIAMNVKDKWNRRWCIAGGLLMVIASIGRLALLTLVMCLLGRWFMDWKRHFQISLLYILLLVIVGGLLIAPEPGHLVGAIVDRFDEARPGASEVRNEVYEANWKGFYKAPLFGHGWPGESLVANEQVYETGAGMVIGSHSTVSGLLYKGGAVTFSIFIFAFLSTVVGLLRQKDSTLLKNSMMIVVAIGVTCFAEGLESLVLPMLFVFLWIGSALSAPSYGRMHAELSLDDAGHIPALKGLGV